MPWTDSAIAAEYNFYYVGGLFKLMLMNLLQKKKKKRMIKVMNTSCSNSTFSSFARLLLMTSFTRRIDTCPTYQAKIS